MTDCLSVPNIKSENVWNRINRGEKVYWKSIQKENIVTSYIYRMLQNLELDDSL